MEKKKILYHSEEAAMPVNLDLWKSASGKLFVKEDAARYDGCTHNLCECGKEKEKYYTKCNSCRGDYKMKNYLLMPYKEYDGTPCTLWDSDVFFSGEDEIESYLEDLDPEDRPKELCLIMCEEAYLPEVDYVDIVASKDIMWEEWEGNLPKEVEEKVKELNEVIKKQKSISWVEGKYRTTYEVVTL